MFLAKFISRSEGVGAKSGRAWYRLELIAQTIDGGSKVLQEFVTKQAFEQCAGIETMTDIHCKTGVTNTGHLTICGVKVAS